jgi:hypothetical protein
MNCPLRYVGTRLSEVGIIVLIVFIVGALGYFAAPFFGYHQRPINPWGDPEAAPEMWIQDPLDMVLMQSVVGLGWISLSIFSLIVTYAFLWLMKRAILKDYKEWANKKEC